MTKENKRKREKKKDSKKKLKKNVMSQGDKNKSLEE